MNQDDLIHRVQQNPCNGFGNDNHFGNGCVLDGGFEGLVASAIITIIGFLMAYYILRKK